MGPAALVRARWRDGGPAASGARRARHGLRVLRARLAPRALPAGSLPPAPAPTPVRLLVGPANSAGQAWAWARAAEQHDPDVSARVVAVRRPLAFPADALVDPAVYRRPEWGRSMQEWAVTHASHVLTESVRPVLGGRHAGGWPDDVALLRGHGLRVAAVAHGSDVRLPSRHAQLYPWSPFRADARLSRLLERQAERAARLLATFEGPVFVSTPDLLDFVPAAAWLPVVVDVAAWAGAAPPLRSAVPVVLHAPSNAGLKGSEHVEPVLRALQAEGLLRYVRAERVPPARMPALVRSADVVLEQFSLGLYSVAACEAMAAGRLVLGHVHDRVRDRLPMPLPVVETPPDRLEQVLRSVVADRDRYAAVAATGPAYASEVHDGRRSAQVLRQWFDAG